jgi:hypothetical protein
MAIPWAIVATGVAYYELKTEPATVPMMVLVDEETRVLATAQAREWTFPEQARADIARRWVWYMRNRPRADGVTIAMRAQAGKITARGSQAANDADLMIRELDEKLAHGDRHDETKLGLAVREGIESAPLGHDAGTDTTVIGVYWQERTESGDGRTGPWEHRYMNVHVRQVEQTRTAEIEANGTGLYVVGISPIGTGRPPAVRTAEARQ